MKSDKVKVYCRFRPQLQNEISKNGKSCIQIDTNELNDEIKIIVPFFFFQLQDDEKKRDLSFYFPKIFQPTSKQEDLFNSIGISKTQELIDGYNVCVFAYGQTGSGKTYTMFNMV
jgi:kinesin family member C1